MSQPAPEENWEFEAPAVTVPGQPRVHSTYPTITLHEAMAFAEFFPEASRFSAIHYCLQQAVD